MFSLYLIAAVLLPSVLADECPCWDMDEAQLEEHCEFWMSGSNPDKCPGLSVVEYDSCVCCKRCTRVENEVCGGKENVLGTCSPGFKCKLFEGNDVFGLCNESTDEEAILAQNYSPPMFPNEISEDAENALGHVFF